MTKNGACKGIISQLCEGYLYNSHSIPTPKYFKLKLLLMGNLFFTGESSSLGAGHGTSVSSLTTHASSTSSVPNEDTLAIPPPPDGINGADQQRKRRPSNRGPREYVPVYRSGPYALVLTLYRHYRVC